ncbi:MAG: OmpA family protein, partial [Bacteroidales bacterium]|nr:OmpA family protein [Bacteroidales bacterium]
KSITILKGVVRDQDSLNPILAHIELVDNETNTLIYETYSDSITGDYFVTLLAGKSYGISVSAEGYLFYSEYFDIPDTAKFEEIEKEILLSPIKEGGKLVLKNIFFEFGKSTLREESFVELGFAVKVFKENPNMRVEISGHTDNVGGYQENINLSTDRAKSVLKYLVDNGIDPARLEYKGYGYDEPIASNDTEEGRQQNRRVEFKILSE